MKLKNIIISGAGLLAVTACNDYLEVEAPSKFSPETIYKSSKDVGTALNGVYAELMSNHTFGQGYTYNLVLNSDVDFVSNSNESQQSNTPKRYDVNANSSTANNTWNATYTGIETANNFIYYLQNSSIYHGADSLQLKQYMGEAKVIRAMFYYELLCYWGDVPFTLLPTNATKDFKPAITSRDVIARAVMEDLMAIAPSMRPASELSEGIERISKEACWAMIARIGLQAAGYSLRHTDDATSYGYMGKPSAEEETWFLTQTRTYADSVINHSNHSLNLAYQDVFLNECNFKVISDDDVLFEIPFAKETSGCIGYRHGPEFRSNGGSTNYEWGETKGNQQVEAFYRYSFKPGDMRKNATVGWWYYTYDGIPKFNSGYSMYNNKWSKLYDETGSFGKSTTDNTGINYPYLRLADVLLMYAEADVKLTKAVNTTAANYVKAVRDRAYKGSSVAAPAIAATDSASFMDEILLERKWEFAGENMRWKDLVRNNKLAEVLYYTFMRYNAVASEVGGVSESTINGYVVDYDGVDYFNEAGDVFTQAEIDAALPGDMAYGQQAGKPKGSILASKIYYCWIENPNDNSYFANKKLRTLYIFNKESKDVKNWNSVNTPKKFMEYIQKEVDKLNDPSVVVAPNPEKVKRIQQLASYTWIPDPENPSATLTSAIPSADYFNWYYSENGYAKNQVLYSLYGFIHGGATDKSNYYFVRDGKEELIGSLGQFQAHPTNLPVVRYLLPIPREAITRSEGAYKNYYGY